MSGGAAPPPHLLLTSLHTLEGVGDPRDLSGPLLWESEPWSCPEPALSTSLLQGSSWWGGSSSCFRLSKYIAQSGRQ